MTSKFTCELFNHYLTIFNNFKSHYYVNVYINELRILKFQNFFTMISKYFQKISILLLVFLIYKTNSKPLELRSNLKNESSLTIRKKPMINPTKWALKWFEKNKIELIPMNDQEIEFKLLQKLVKYSKMNQKIFDQIFNKILIEKKKLLSILKLSKFNIYSIRRGK